MMIGSEIIMYQTEDGLTKIETTFNNDTVWLSIDQMAELFQLILNLSRCRLIEEYRCICRIGLKH